MKDKPKRAYGRSAVRYKTHGNALYYFITSEEIFGRIALGKQDYFVIGENGKWWRKNKDSMRKNKVIIIRVAAKKILTIKAHLKSWEASDDPEYRVSGVVGIHRVIRLKDIEATPFAKFHARNYLGENGKRRKEKRDETILKSKIRQAFK